MLQVSLNLSKKACQSFFISYDWLNDIVYLLWYHVSYLIMRYARAKRIKISFDTTICYHIMIFICGKLGLG